MQKLGMKPVTGVSRVTIKKSKNVRTSLLKADSCAQLGRKQPSMFCTLGVHLARTCAVHVLRHMQHHCSAVLS